MHHIRPRTPGFGQEHPADHRCWRNKPLLPRCTGRPARTPSPATRGRPRRHRRPGRNGEPSTAGARSRPGSLGVKPRHVAGQNFGARTRQVTLRRRSPKEVMNLYRSALPRLLSIGAMLVALVATLFVGSVANSVGSSASTFVSAVTADHAADWARSRKGSPYVYGATGPHRFDCSGLTRWVYARVG